MPAALLRGWRERKLDSSMFRAKLMLWAIIYQNSIHWCLISKHLSIILSYLFHHMVTMIWASSFLSCPLGSSLTPRLKTARWWLQSASAGPVALHGPWLRWNWSHRGGPGSGWRLQMLGRMRKLIIWSLDWLRFGCFVKMGEFMQNHGFQW